MKKYFISLLKKLPVISSYERNIAELNDLKSMADIRISRVSSENTVLKSENKDLEEQIVFLDNAKKNADARIMLLDNAKKSADEQAARINNAVDCAGKQIAGLQEQNRILQNSLVDIEVECSFLKEREDTYKREILALNNNLVRAYEEMFSLEKRIDKAKEGFVLFDKFKNFAIREFSELKAEHDELKLDYAEKVSNLKHRIASLINVARAYKYEANDYAMDMLTRTLEGANISAILLDGEKIDYVTSYVSEKTGITEGSLVGRSFADVFDSESLDAFCRIGPQHPLKIRESEKKFAGILFSFTMGHDAKTKKLKNYRAIWLVDDRKIGLSSYFKGTTVAMPRQITAAAAKKAVGSYLNASIGAFAKSRDFVLDCSASASIEQDAADYLADVCRTDACRLFVKQPREFVYSMLAAAGFPEANIKAYSAEKESKVMTHVFGLGLSHA